MEQKKAYERIILILESPSHLLWKMREQGFEAKRLKNSL